MSSTSSSALLRDVDRTASIGALDKFLSGRGYERVANPSNVEPHVVRASVQTRGRWTTCSLEKLDDPTTLAKPLSKALGCLALASWYWDGESVTRLSLFENGAARGSLELPRDARRVDTRKIAVPLGSLSRLVGDGSRQDGLEIRVPIAEQSLVFVSLEEAANAFRRAFGIEQLFVDPNVDDDVLVYRPKATSTAGKRVRARAEEEARRAELRAAYDARIFAVGWLAFVAKPTAKLLASVAQPLAETFDELGVLDVRVVDASRRSTGVTRDWKSFATTLGRGDLVELRSAVATVCLVHADEVFSVSFSVRGPKDPARRRELAACFDEVVMRATGLSGCFGALVTAQHRPLVLEQRALAYEYLRGKSEHALRPSRTQPRAPGWRTLVPNGAGSPPPGFSARETKAGLLVASDADDPWSVSGEACDRLEAWLF